MNKSLEHIYTHPEWWLNARQREYFCEYVRELLDNPRFQDNTARRILGHIWHGYDVGWHSVGRSPRSLLLEASMSAMDWGDIEKAKSLFSILIAMYHMLNTSTVITGMISKWKTFVIADFVKFLISQLREFFSVLRPFLVSEILPMKIYIIWSGLLNY